MDPIEQLKVRSLWLEWRRAERLSASREDQFRAYSTALNADAAHRAEEHALEAFIAVVKRIG